MDVTIQLDSTHNQLELFGPADEYLRLLCHAFDVQITARQHKLVVAGKDKDVQKAVAKFPDDRLEMPLVEGGRSAYNNLHGHVQHTLYHAGQILMLKKILTKS